MVLNTSDGLDLDLDLDLDFQIEDLLYCIYRNEASSLKDTTFTGIFSTDPRDTLESGVSKIRYISFDHEP